MQEATKSPLEKAVDHIVYSTPARSPERWRAAAALWLASHPQNRYEAALVAESCREQRAASLTEFGTSGDTNSALRSPLSMPAAMLAVIEIADPGLLDPDEAKANVRKLARTFPEFCPLEKL